MRARGWGRTTGRVRWYRLRWTWLTPTPSPSANPNPIPDPNPDPNPNPNQVETAALAPRLTVRQLLLIDGLNRDHLYLAQGE